MVMIAAKLNKRKMCLIVILLILAAVTLSILLKGASTPPKEQTPTADTAEGRIAYLRTFGYTVDESPVKEHTVCIPTEPDEVFDRYNRLQQSQGFDLQPLAGKSVQRYVYRVTGGVSEDEAWNATLLVYEGKVVGADLSSGAPGGRMLALVHTA